MDIHEPNERHETTVAQSGTETCNYLLRDDGIHQIPSNASSQQEMQTDTQTDTRKPLVTGLALTRHNS